RRAPAHPVVRRRRPRPVPGRDPRRPPAPRPAGARRSPGTGPRSRRSRSFPPSSRGPRPRVVAVRLLAAARRPQQAALDDGAYVRIRGRLDPVAGGGPDDAAPAPLAGPVRGGGDLAVPRVPLARLLRGGGEHVDGSVAGHPVLLGGEVEVL